MSIPVVKLDEKGIPTLYVDGRPFFCRSGELHNSSASSLEYMKEKIWPALRGLNMNSCILPVYWELMESQEGVYDFSLFDGILEQARQEGLKLILLWFGLWKNAESMYVPGWMKKDTETYFRARKVNGELMTTISPLCEAAVEKDRLAFTALMGHIRSLDEEENTVIVIQVENEIGLLGTDRDYSPQANEAFAGEIPEELAKVNGKTGTWSQVFGEEAAESFMAWHFGRAVERIASSGKAVYDLPCYTNAWLRQYPWYPGSYPSGGPVCHMHPIWRAAAPSLFAFGPDIYVPYCADIFDEYASEQNPLFIPEVRKDAVAASYCLYAFLAKNALCFSPFGIEEITLPPEAIDKPPMEVMIALNIDPSAFDITGSKDFLAAAYGLMKDIEPLYLQYRGTDALKAFCRHGEYDYGTFLRFSETDIAVSYGPRMSAKPLGAGAVLELERNRFLLIGMNCSMSFRPKPDSPKKLDILRMEEGRLVDGKWVGGRVLNGDEKMALSFPDMVRLVMMEVYPY